MTAVAARTKLASMHVVRLVATAAGRRHVAEISTFISMAAAAGNVRVPTIQLESGLLTMIEQRYGPLIAGVTGCAVRSKRSTVHVVFGVAANTILVRVFKLIG